MPPDVEENPLRGTEINVYNRLQHQLNDDWVVFYSRPWLGLTPTGEEVDGECDFVIAHADHGILCVEVKGGRILWDSLENRWTSLDRNDIPHRIKDPVAQARNSKYHLIQRLKEQPGLGHRRLRIQHGVIFPDCMAPTHDMGPDRPRFIFCFEGEFGRNLAGWVQSRLTRKEENTGRDEAPGPEGIRVLIDLLAGPLTFRIPLAHVVRTEDETLEYLTQQQYHLVEAFDSMPRVSIQGGAGTGKSVLAAHFADWLAGKGLQTALVCYNEALAVRLAGRLANTRNLQVCSFHTLCLRSLHAAGRTVIVPADSHEDFFELQLPQALLEIRTSAGVQRFDAIVVDEGQDFRQQWWIALESLFADAGPKLLRVFLDCNQLVYGGVAAYLQSLNMVPFHLSWNLRNTRAIHEAVYRYYSGRAVSCRGPEGEPPERTIVAENSSYEEELSELVGRLIEREALLAEDIAVIVPDATWIKRLAPEGNVADVPTQDASREQSGYLTLDTIRRFKGLESRILIVVVDTGLGDAAELCYVALSRGRTRVFLLGAEECLNRLKSASRLIAPRVS